VHPRRADRRLRHHARTARERRAGADDRGSPEGVSEGAMTTPGRALEGRAILVTGAHGGLGRAVALACAQAGATAVLLGRKSRRLEQVADAIEKAGGDALLYPLDLEGAVPDDYAELAARLGERPGRLDGVVHCAAEFAGLTPLEHTDPAAFARPTRPRWWSRPLPRRARRRPTGAVTASRSAAWGRWWRCSTRKPPPRRCGCARCAPGRCARRCAPAPTPPRTTAWRATRRTSRPSASRCSPRRARPDDHSPGRAAAVPDPGSTGQHPGVPEHAAPARTAAPAHRAGARTADRAGGADAVPVRSEEHTSE